MRRARHPFSVSPPPDDDSVIESQRTPLAGRTYFPTKQADIAQLARIARAPAFSNPDAAPHIRHITRPGGVQKVDWGAKYTVAAGRPQLLIPQNDRRKGFIIGISSLSPQTCFFSYGSSKFSQWELFPGSPWVEEGSEVSVDNIWVYSPIVGQVFLAVESIPLEFRRDEFWTPR